VERLRKRGDRRQAKVVEQWLEQLKADFTGRFLMITARVAERWGVLNAASVRPPAVDGLLAATAIENDLTFVTRERGALEATGVALLDPWRTT
jgi:toxin FitB